MLRVLDFEMLEEEAGATKDDVRKAGGRENFIQKRDTIVPPIAM